MVVLTRVPMDAVTDPKDRHVLATATAGQADFLVTGNLKHFPRRYEGTGVLSPAEFVEMVKPLIRDSI
jgi:predicted nucleic acid-binding protein